MKSTMSSKGQFKLLRHSIKCIILSDYNVYRILEKILFPKLNLTLLGNLSYFTVKYYQDTRCQFFNV